MKVTIAIWAIVGLAAAAPVRSVLRAQQATSRSVLDGVYTAEQAKRGETTYSTSCASCHGPALLGTEMAPPLTGKMFMDNWTDTTASDLFQKINVAMPADDPGTLKKEQTADLVAYILRISKFPAGTTELASEADALKQIKIVAPKP
jgi:mono/diheme cytochrome c family protein